MAIPHHWGDRVATGEPDLEGVEEELRRLQSGPAAHPADSVQQRLLNRLRHQLEAAFAAALRDGVDIDPLLYRVDVDELAVDRVFKEATGHAQVAAGLAALVWERTLRKLATRAAHRERFDA